MSKTLQDLRNQAYGILKTNESATAYPTILMDSFLNKAQNDICIGNLKNIKTGEILMKPQLNFLNKDTFYKSVTRSTISQAFVAGATTVFTSSTSSFPSSWALWIDGMIVTYTATTSTSFTGCSGLITSMGAGAKLYSLSPLSSDFSQMTSAYYIPSSGGSQSRMIGIDYRDFKETVLNLTSYNVQRQTINWEYYYTIINGLYILAFAPVSGNNIRFEYQKLPTTMTLTSDLVTIPDTYCLNTIPYIAVSEFLFNRGEPDIWIELNNFWYNNVKTMYAFYNDQQVEKNYNQRVRTSRDGFINV